MRRRDESLRTGTLLVAFHPEDPRRNASLLFLVRGAADIGPLRDIQEVSQELIAEDERFQWHTVANQLELTSVDPRLDSSRVVRLEVCEFQALSRSDLQTLLAPAIEQLRRLERVCFPSATRTEGSVAKGADFLDRQEALAELQRRVEDRQPVLLVAPRRSGKTSLLYKLAEQLTPGLRPELIDVEKFRDAEAFTAELLVRAEKPRFVEALKQVRRQGWRSVLPTALSTLNRPTPLVLLLDELAWFLEHLAAAKAHELLAALSEELVKSETRLIVAGSLDLDRLSHDQLGLELPGLFGRLTRFALPPMAKPRLALNLRRVLLGTGLVLEPGDLNWLIQNVDLAMPYPALRFLAHLSSVAHARPSLSPRDLEQELVDDLASTTAFCELEEQLKQLAQREGRAAEGIEDALDHLARADGALDVSDVKALLGDDPAQQATHFAWLVEHFPLNVEGARVELASCLFRRYWRTHGGANP